MTRFIAWLALLPGLVAPQGPATRKSDPQQDLAGLARDLDAAFAAKNGAETFKLVRAFVAAHRPADTGVELLSPDKKVHFVLGANGTTARPDAPDVLFTPKGSVYSIAIGGDGGNPAKGSGGRGGTVLLKAKAKGKVLLLGGAGGKGADAAPTVEAGKGGSGGDVWFGDFGAEPVTGQGGPGGTAGAGTATQAAGAGGDGGNVGREPPKKK